MTKPTARLAWPQALSSAGLAGVIAAFLMVLPLRAFALGTLACGALCVIFYRRRNPSANPTAGMGARLGALAGLSGFGILALLLIVQVTVFHSGGQLKQTVMEAVRQAATRRPDPAAQQALEFLNTPQGFAVMLVIGMGFVLAVFVVLAGLGGAIGAAFLRRKEPPGPSAVEIPRDTEFSHRQDRDSSKEKPSSR